MTKGDHECVMAGLTETIRQQFAAAVQCRGSDNRPLAQNRPTSRQAEESRDIICHMTVEASIGEILA
jgi:hypothetical protein